MAVVIPDMDLPVSCVLCPFQTADMVGENLNDVQLKKFKVTI